MRPSIPTPRPLPAAFLVALVVAGSAAAADPKPAGVHLSETGLLSYRDAAGKWQLVAKDEKLSSGRLYLTAPGASLASANGAVRVNAYGNLTGHSPLPIIETAVILHDNPKADLSLTLDRGRIDLTNTKKKGPATVEVKFRNEVWFLTLEEPGTRVAIEEYGRWLGGDQFDPTGKTSKAPRTEVVGLVISGEIHLLADDTEFRMTAPPGPAEFTWDSDTGHAPSPRRVEMLPAWANTETAPTAEVRKYRELIEEYRKLRLEKGVEGAALEYLGSGDPLKCRAAVYTLAATDNLPAVSKALQDPKNRELWDHVVIALRHWLGRGPGQDAKFYKYLIEERKLTPARAETILHLLHDPGPEDRARPETYETLIDYLEHEALGIRALAHWHLVRLVPEGKDIPFDPYATPEELAKAHAAWRKLVPPGKLPLKKKPA